MSNLCANFHVAGWNPTEIPCFFPSSAPLGVAWVLETRCHKAWASQATRPHGISWDISMGKSIPNQEMIWYMDYIYWILDTLAYGILDYLHVVYVPLYSILLDVYSITYGLDNPYDTSFSLGIGHMFIQDIYVCMYVCMYVYIFIYIYIYLYIYIYIYSDIGDMI